MLEKNIDDNWNADVDRDLSDTWTGFTRFTILIETPQDGYMWSRRRLTRKQTTSRPEKLWPAMWKHMSDASKRKEKQKWVTEKPKFDHARSLRGIYFIDSKDEEFKEIMENACRKLEIPVPAAMPCRTRTIRSNRETCSNIGKHQTKFACIVEADESMRLRLEGVRHRYHEDHIAVKGTNSLSY